MMNPKHKAALAALFVVPGVLLALAGVVGAFRKPSPKTTPATATAPATATPGQQADTAPAPPVDPVRPAGLPLSAAMQPGAVDRMAQAQDDRGATWAPLGASPAPEAAPLAVVDIAAAGEAAGWRPEAWMRSTRAGWWRVDKAGRHTLLLRVSGLPGGFGVVDTARCMVAVSGYTMQTEKHDFTMPKDAQVVGVADMAAGWHEVALQCDVAGAPAQHVRAELAATDGDAAPVVIPLFQPVPAPAAAPKAGAGG